MLPAAAPPSLVESVQGRVTIKDKEDSRNTKGHLSWAPVYQMYKFAAAAAAASAQAHQATTAAAAADADAAAGAGSAAAAEAAGDGDEQG